MSITVVISQNTGGQDDRRRRSLPTITGSAAAWSGTSRSRSGGRTRWSRSARRASPRTARRRTGPTCRRWPPRQQRGRAVGAGQCPAGSRLDRWPLLGLRLRVGRGAGACGCSSKCAVEHVDQQRERGHQRRMPMPKSHHELVVRHLAGSLGCATGASVVIGCPPCRGSAAGRPARGRAARRRARAVRRRRGNAAAPTAGASTPRDQQRAVGVAGDRAAGLAAAASVSASGLRRADPDRAAGRHRADDVGDRALRDQLAGRDDHQVVGQQLHLGQQVAGDQDGPALAGRAPAAGPASSGCPRGRGRWPARRGSAPAGRRAAPRRCRGAGACPASSP